MMQTEHTDDGSKPNERNENEYAVQKLRIIKNAFARQTSFDFVFRGQYYRVDGASRIIREVDDGIESEPIEHFNDSEDFLNRLFFDGQTFGEKAITDEFVITSF